ncbi:putative small GTP-binding protein [Neospora caninum Liverpool]|uniref:GTPase Der n=1 Tax=Neospora caninum (strain Liverpool) TaxID=572307 RepID=F0VFA8_NEOCL|nr:putative small GTP-binding protein [Neospora caninum Liverpool]CBZ52402.1 putative small GTP-binding protein [Neospora caninum Liverpool]|eukprot:XP_003882434.1 putative small GTP-binding protein [Neospora caninum Liverpool]
MRCGLRRGSHAISRIHPKLQRSPDPSIRPLKVVLVGRPNVGKSSLFNRLISGTRGHAASSPFAPLKRLQQAIVSPQAGTSRDRKEARAVFGGLQLLLVDTGGLEDTETTEACALLTNMRKQVRFALRDADSVLFLIDATEGVTPVDVLLSRLLNEWLDEQQRLDIARQEKATPRFPHESLIVRASAASVAAAQAEGGGSLRQRAHAGAAGRVSLVADTGGGPPKRQSRQTRTDGTGNDWSEWSRGNDHCLAHHSRDGREAASRDSAGNGRLSPLAEHERMQNQDPGDAEEVERIPVILVVNKADGCFFGDYLADCYDLHLGAPVLVSAKKNEGMDDLYDRLVLEVGHLQDTTEGLFGSSNAVEEEDEGALGSVEDSASQDEGSKESDCEGESPAEAEERPHKEEDSGSDYETEEGVELLPEDMARLEERMHPPRPSDAAGAWIEGMARRYGECGIEETFKHFSDPNSPQYIPWDLSQTSLAAAAATAAVERKLRSAAKMKQTEEASGRNNEAEGTVSAECPDSQTRGRSGNEDERLQQGSGEDGGAAPTLGKEEIQMAEAELAAASGLSVEAPPDSLRKRLRTKAARDYVLPIRRQLLFDDVINVAVIGRPNAGKSTLVNSLLQEERMVVDSQPGTTTDAVGTLWTFQGHPFRLIDTAGVTRGWKMRHTDLLLEAGLQTLRNIRNAQVCILCIDASLARDTGQPISSHELALAHLASEKEGRCLAVCVTKWDLVPENEREKLRREILERLQTGLGHLKGCPVVFVAAKYGQNVETLMTKIMVLYRRWNARIPTSKLNSWLREFVLRWPPPWRLGSKCQVKYVTQVKARPPTFVAWSNVYNTFPVHYLRQLTNTMREEFSLAGTPLRLILRTTAMPAPGKKLSRADVLKWKRLGPKQHQAVADLARGYRPKKPSAATK